MSNSIAGVPSIVGEQFPDFVVKQIEQRQKIHGSINRTPEQLQYLHAKTAWCTLASSIDITDTSRFKGTPLESVIKKLRANSKLAGNFILQGGVSSPSNASATVELGGELTQTVLSLLQKESGISTTDDNSVYSDNAYGYGGLEFGQVPMPGIISATFRSENRGSLRTGEIRIKAHNKVQFELIDTLFLRLGYTVLFECGWSSYFDNDGNLTENYQSVLGSFLYPEETKLGDESVNVDQDVMLALIRNAKETSNGNYDAMLAKVKNFNWTFNKDGSYDITLSLVSIGDVIESLNMHVVDPKAVIFTTSEEQKKAQKEREELLNDSSAEDSKVLEAFRNTSLIASYLYSLVDYVNNNISGNGILEFFGLGQEVYNKATDTSVQVVESSTTGKVYYIRFDAFLTFLEQYIIPANNSDTPGMRISIEPYYIHSHPDLISCDLTKCAINKTVKISYRDGFRVFHKGYKGYSHTSLPTGAPFMVPDKINIGDLMKVYLNFRFILGVLEAKTNEDGTVPMISFLTEICTGINNSFANLNKISPVYDHDTNTIYFIDETPVDHNWKDESPKAKFELYGYNPKNNTAGFIRDFSLKTELTPAMSTAITVGAQANAKPVGESQTAFTKWNVGLVDRIWKEKYTSTKDIALSPTEQKKAEEVAKENIKNLISQYTDYILSSTVPEDFTENIPILTIPADNDATFVVTSMINFHNREWARSTDATGSCSSDTIGFIPINLSLTMDGMSGMKIYQRFGVDTRFLPSKYTDELEFIVKGINSTIENNQWITNIETFMVPKVVDNPKTSLFDNKEDESSVTIEKDDDSGEITVKPADYTGQGITYSEYKKLKEAIREAVNATLKNVEYINWCAWGAYNIAKNFTLALQGKPTYSPTNTKEKDSDGRLRPSTQYASGGNADTPGYWNSLIKLGYKQTYKKTKLPTSELKIILNDNSQWGIGDVAVYWTVAKDKNGKNKKFMHTQIFTGGHHDTSAQQHILNRKSTTPAAYGPSKWSTDNRNNYGKSFVYETVVSSDWTLMKFDAPIK